MHMMIQNRKGIVCDDKGLKTLINTNLALFCIESRDQDFVVKFKGQLISWRNLSQLLHQHNITVPREQAVLNTVLREKDSSAQSCEGRCFVEERRRKKTCFCDKACEIFSDCCLDFYSR